MGGCFEGVGGQACIDASPCSKSKPEVAPLGYDMIYALLPYTTVNTLLLPALSPGLTPRPLRFILTPISTSPPYADVLRRHPTPTLVRQHDANEMVRGARCEQCRGATPETESKTCVARTAASTRDHRSEIKTWPIYPTVNGRTVGRSRDRCDRRDCLPCRIVDCGRNGVVLLGAQAGMLERVLVCKPARNAGMHAS